MIVQITVSSPVLTRCQRFCYRYGSYGSY